MTMGATSIDKQKTSEIIANVWVKVNKQLEMLATCFYIHIDCPTLKTNHTYNITIIVFIIKETLWLIQ